MDNDKKTTKNINRTAEEIRFELQRSAVKPRYFIFHHQPMTDLHLLKPGQNKKYFMSAVDKTNVGV